MEIAVADFPLLGIRTRMIVSVLLATSSPARSVANSCGAQWVAMRIGAAVHADHQDVDRPVVAAMTQGRSEDVVDPVLEGADLAPGDSGAENDHHGRHGRNHTNHALRRHHTRLLASQWYRW